MCAENVRVKAAACQRPRVSAGTNTFAPMHIHSGMNQLVTVAVIQKLSVIFPKTIDIFVNSLYSGNNCWVGCQAFLEKN